MKKLLIAVVLVALVVPVMAFGANPYSNVKPELKGMMTSSVVAEANNKKMSATTKLEGDTAVVTVSFEDGTREVWKIANDTIMHNELDKDGKVVATYGGKAQDLTKANERTFFVNCKDKAKPDCDQGLDPRGHWKVISKSNGGLIYTYNNVAKNEVGNQSAVVKERLKIELDPTTK